MLTNEELRAEAEAARGVSTPMARGIYRDRVSDPEVVIRLLDEIDRLKATTCRNPDASMCVKAWEDDWQSICLEHHGLAGEFSGGPDAIYEVAESLLAVRRERDRLVQRVAKLESTVTELEQELAEWTER